MRRFVFSLLFLMAACSSSPQTPNPSVNSSADISSGGGVDRSNNIDLGQKLPPAPLIELPKMDPNRGRLNVWLKAYDPCRTKPCPEEAPETEEDRRRYSVPYRR